MAQAYDAARIAEAVAEIRSRIADTAKAAGRNPEDILLCAVCKTRTSQTVRESAVHPVDLFGENHMQELVTHYDDGAYLGKPCHFIGHLQTNKVKKVVGRVQVIESVDSLKLLNAVNKEAGSQGLRQDVMFEVNIGGEASKTGASVEDLRPMIEAAEDMEHVRMRGLMAIPPSFDNSDTSRGYFAQLRELLEKIKAENYKNALWTDLSMGMSASYEAAIMEGATIVRIGRALYGERDYPAKA